MTTQSPAETTDGLRYRTSTLRADYIRSGVGLASTVAPLVLVDLAAVPFYLLSAGALLFAGFTARTLVRQMSRFTITDSELRLEGLRPSTISWSAIQSLELRYFSTRRDRSDGWMQLDIKGNGRVIRIESSLPGFPDLAARAARAAQEKRLQLKAATRANFAALDIPLDAPEPLEPPAARPQPTQPRSAGDSKEGSAG